MKGYNLFIVFLFAAVAAKAQDGVTQIQVTDELRQKFAREAKAPEPWQIVTETPPSLQKRTTSPLLAPDPSQIITETPPALRKKTLPVQNTTDTPPASSTPKQ